MAQELGIRQATACVLANRGLAARKDAVHFMQGGMDALEDPGQMKDMEKGISFLANAIQQKKKIVVYGDYAPV